MASINDLPAGTWTVDASHSEIGFVARHLMVTKVRGQFKEFEGTVKVGDDFDRLHGAATVPSSPPSTPAPPTATPTSSPADFFDAETNPTMSSPRPTVTADELVGRPDHQGRHQAGHLRPGVHRRLATDPWGNHEGRLRGHHRDQPQGLRPELERRPRGWRRARRREGQARPGRPARQGCLSLHADPCTHEGRVPAERARPLVRCCPAATGCERGMPRGVSAGGSAARSAGARPRGRSRSG